MIFVKLAVVAWVLFFIIRFFVASHISGAEKFNLLIGKKLDLTPGRIIMVLVLLSAVGLTVVSVIWFLFFSGII